MWRSVQWRFSMAAELLEKHMRSTSHQWMHERSDMFVCSIFDHKLFNLVYHELDS